MRNKKEQPSKEDVAIENLWSKDDYQMAKNKYSCEIISQNCSATQLKEKNLPNDTYIVTHKNEDGNVVSDLVRGKRSSIFDLYWDKIRESLVSIGWAYGTVNPRLWEYNASNKNSKSNKKS